MCAFKFFNTSAYSKILISKNTAGFAVLSFPVWRDSCVSYVKNSFERYKFDDGLYKLYMDHNPLPFLFAIAAINVYVTFLWKKAHFSTALKEFLLSQFTVSYQGLLKKRYVTVFSHMFSHSSVLHLALNLLCLSSFSMAVYPAIGSLDFFKLYLGGGVAGCFSHLLHSRILGRTAIPALGLSAAAYSIFAASCLLYPYSKIAIVILPQYPIEARKALLIAAGLELSGVILNFKIMSHSGHLGGLLFGVLMFEFLCKTKGTTTDGFCVLNSKIYRGPLKDYKPIGEGTVIFPDKRVLRMSFEPISEFNRKMRYVQMGPSFVKSIY